MHGSVSHQINNVFHSVKAFGQSKHEAKQDARQNVENYNWHDVGKQLDVYSYATADQYRDIWASVFVFTRANFGIKDLEKLSDEHIKAYLDNKIANDVKYSTLQKYMAALEKLETALNKYAIQHQTNNTYNFDLRDIRTAAQNKLDHTHTARAYDDPLALINEIKDSTYKTIATAQLQGGFRISELNYLSAKNFLDNNIIKITNAKGGLIREIELPEKTYNELKALVDNSDGKFIFNVNQYRSTLNQAATATQQAYTGSHGLRWCYAQSQYINYQKQGYGPAQALQKVSHDLGHHRPDITRHYLQF